MKPSNKSVGREKRLQSRMGVLASPWTRGRLLGITALRICITGVTGQSELIEREALNGLAPSLGGLDSNGSRTL